MAPRQHYEFGPFRLDPSGGVLFRDGERLALTPKAIEVLTLLVEAQGSPVTKDELLQRVWADGLRRGRHPRFAHFRPAKGAWYRTGQRAIHRNHPQAPVPFVAPVGEPRTATS